MRVVALADPHLLRVLIAGPGGAASRALRLALERSPGITTCGEVGDGAAAVRVAARERADVCLLVDEPGFDWSGVAAALAGRLQGIAVVLAGGEADDDTLLAAVAAGASGYVEAHAEPEVVAAALLDVVAGRPAFPRRVVALLVAAVREEVDGA